MEQETKEQKIKRLMKLPIQRTYGSWNKLSIDEIDKKIKEAQDLGIKI